MTIFLAILMVWLMPTVAAHAQRSPTEPTAAQSEPIHASPKESSQQLERPLGRDAPLAVKLAIYVIDIDDVDSAEQNFSGSVYYEAHWNSPALRHQGPGPLTRETADIWTPRLTIINSACGRRSPTMSKYHPTETYDRRFGGRSRNP
jgi:Neurotransmitter-gated ion-channel ligand binding domain